MKYHCDDCDAYFRRREHLVRHYGSKAHKEQTELQRHDQDVASSPNKRLRVVQEDDQDPQQGYDGGGDYDYTLNVVDDSGDPNRGVSDDDNDESEAHAWDIPSESDLDDDNDEPKAWDIPSESDLSDSEDEAPTPQQATPQGV